MRIYKPPQGSALFAAVHAHWLPFDLEKDKWIYVDSIPDAQVVPMMNHHSPDRIKQELGSLRHDQLLVMLQIFHMSDNQDCLADCERKANMLRDSSQHVAVIHTNSMNQHADHIYYDLMLNRHKVYYINYDDHDLSNRLWSLSANKQTYDLKRLDKCPNAKKFLCLNRIYYQTADNHRIRYRIALANHLKHCDGWISDPHKGVIIEPEAMTTDMKYHLLSGAGTWWPAARFYYENSYVSIYVETLTHSPLAKLITEKTYDPLIQGHFILPFGYCGLIQDIVDRGFRLPGWIDYSYDSIAETDERFAAFVKEVDRILSLDTGQLHDLWQQDHDLLEFNRHQFWKLPYDSLHHSIQTRYNLSCR